MLDFSPSSSHIGAQQEVLKFVDFQLQQLLEMKSFSREISAVKMLTREKLLNS
jgi:hypothetical protein